MKVRENANIQSSTTPRTPYGKVTQTQVKHKLTSHTRRPGDHPCRYQLVTTTL